MTTRALILQADEAARKQGLTQAAWSDKAGLASGGQGVSKLLKRGDCKLSTLVALLRPLCMTIKIVEEDSHGPHPGI